jgi:hypothetical protein
MINRKAANIKVALKSLTAPKLATDLVKGNTWELL